MTPRTMLIVWALAASVTACGGTETGNPGGAEVGLGVRASDPAQVGVGSDGTGHHAEAVLLAVENAGLTPCEGGAPETSLFEKAIIVDLVMGAPGARAVPTGAYCGVRIALTPRALPDVAGAPAVGDASIAIHGVRADGIPFTAVSRTARTIVASGERFVVQDGDALLLAFDVSPWLAGGILEEAPIVDGRATIDGTGQSAAQFEQQITVGLHRDLDRNGAVDGSETTPLVVVGPDGAQ